MTHETPSRNGSRGSFEFWCRLLVRHRRVLVVLSLLSLVLLPGLFMLSTDNSPAVFFVRDAGELERYSRFRETFGSDRALRLVVSGDELFSERGLLWLEELETRVAEMPGVISAIGPYGRHSLMGWPPWDVEGFSETLASSRFDRSLGVVDSAGETVTVFLTLEPMVPAETQALLGELRRLLGTAPAGVEAHLVGMPELAIALDDSSREIEQRYFPLLVLFAILILFAVFREAMGIVLPLAFVAACELWVLGPMGYLGVDLNMILAVLPPLVFVIALATALHLLLHDRFLRAKGEAPMEAAVESYRTKGWAVFWTGVSTLVGFFSLAASPVGPVRTLGIWAGVGLAFLTFLAFTFYPAAIVASGSRGLPPRLGAFERRARALGRRWAHWADTNRRAVLLGAGLLAAIALAGVPQIRVESNALRYLGPEHPVRSSIEALEAKGIGVSALEVVIPLPTEEGFAAPEAIGRLAELTAELEAEPLVLGAVSLGNLVDDAGRRLPLPERDPEVVRRMVLQTLEANPEVEVVLDSLVSESRSRARLTLFVETVGWDDLEPLVERAREAATIHFPEARSVVTGQFLLLVEMQRHLISTLIVSLALTLLVIAVIFRLLLPGTRFTLLALLPNLWPVVGVLGIMGWFGIPLDVATVMVASIVLGLAVDDTIHTLGHFRHLAPVHGSRRAVVHTLEQTAPAYLLTGLILAAGFGVCALSDFNPTARFGALSAVAIGFAVLGDLFLLPALLSLTPRKTVGRMSSPDTKDGGPV